MVVLGGGGFGGGRIAADHNVQTSTYLPTVLGEFWPDAEEGQCAADLSARIGPGWFWWFGASVWTNETEGTARHEPRLAAVELIPYQL